MDTLILNADGQPMSLLPLSGRPWQKAIPEMWMGNATVLHSYEDWEVRSPSISLMVPAVLVMNKFKNAKRLVRFNRRNVFVRDGYTCQYCLQQFAHGELTYDHVQPQTYGGKTTWTNISTACRRCNGARGCNEKIKPKKMPYKPSYWEMIDKIKRHPIVIPHESWTYYLDWDPDLVRVKGRNTAH